MSVRGFYDALAPWYHVVYEDWERSISRQAEALSTLIADEWGAGVRRILDAAAGIGTQAVGLAAHGYEVVGSDLSLAAVRRAVVESRRRNLTIPFVVADMRALPLRDGVVDAAIACDNALPHLLSEDAIRVALSEMKRCIRPGGGCVISMRDYGDPPRAGTVEFQDYGERRWGDRGGSLRQVRRWRGALYDMAFELIATDGSGDVLASTPQTTYFAVRPASVADLATEVGFASVRRLDGRLFQPVLVGTA